MECIGQHWAGHKIPEICEIQICIEVPVLLNSIWKLISTSLFVCLCGFMYFFRFLPLSSSFFHFLLEETGRNTFFPVSSILPRRNLFLPEISEPWFDTKKPTTSGWALGDVNAMGTYHFKFVLFSFFVMIFLLEILDFLKLFNFFPLPVSLNLPFCCKTQ